MKSSKKSRFDWVSVFLLLLMLQTASARLVITQWTTHLTFSQSLATLGLILGLALGYSQFKRPVVIWLVIGYSSMLIPWQMSRAIEGDVLLSERLVSVGGRLLFALGQFFRRETVEDSLLFVAAISILVWFISLASGYWWARHRNYLAAALPGGIFTFTIHLYDWIFPARVWLLALYILWALFLLGRFQYLQNRELWTNKRIFQTQESEFDLTRGMLLMATIFVFVAWVFPASAASWQTARVHWYRATKPWREVQEWFSNAIEVLESPQVRREGDFYTSRLDLGEGNPLSDNVIFTVEAPELTEKPPRFYWRGYTYGTYSDFHWGAISTNSDEFSPSGEQILIPNIEDKTLARFKVTTQIRQFLIYTATQPIWVSRPGEIRYASTDTEALDIAAWYAEPGMLAGEQFQMDAALANPSIQDLQAAGENYPDWIVERYLQLPEDFSPRIRALAEEISTDLETPYDKASAITDYLRREIDYSNPLPESPPENADPLEWILFDLKQGFCNYYASAEVVMLRSIEIPARLAVGFTEGVFDSESNTYSIRNLDAHAWPEVYFPGIGWIEFEPTGNQDPIFRPDIPEEESLGSNGPLGGNPNNPGLNPTDDFFPERKLEFEEGLSEIDEIAVPDEQTKTNPLYYYSIIAVVLLGLLWLVNRQFAFINRIPVRLQTAYERNWGHAPGWLDNWAHWSKLTPIQRSFETINRSLRLLGKPPALNATPTERADLLISRLPTATDAIKTLAEEHQSSLFTPEPGDAGRARRASLSIWMYTIQNIVHDFIYGRPIE
jgi:transglutaminase-like putative cysteine protease